MTTVVLKFGGTSVRDAGRLRAVARHIASRREAGAGVVAVVSAMGSTTDDLLALSRELTDRLGSRELDRLMATGECASASLLVLALEVLGVPARSFTGAEAGIRTTDAFGRARILAIDPAPLRSGLAEGLVPVVAGFQGARADGELTTLGRGGSDTSAVAIAAALGLPCEIYTDVAGVFAADPRTVPDAHHRPFLSHDALATMAAHGGKVVARRAVELAATHDVPLQVRSSFTWRPGTVVRSGNTPLETPGVAGVSADTTAVLVTLDGVSNDAATVGAVLTALGNAQVAVHLMPGGPADAGSMSVIVARDDVAAAVDAVADLVDRRGGRVRCNRNVALIGVAGTGLTSHPGIVGAIASTVGAIRADAHLLIAAPTVVSWLVAADAATPVVRALCESLGLRDRADGTADRGPGRHADAMTAAV